MSVSKETLRAMMRELHLVELSEEELDMVLPDVESYLSNIAEIRNLDLSRVPSARQLRARERGKIS